MPDYQDAAVSDRMMQGDGGMMEDSDNEEEEERKREQALEEGERETNLKVEGNVQDVEFLHIKVNTNRGLVVVGEDIVTKAVDHARLADSNITNHDTLCDPEVIFGSHNVPVTELPDRSIESELVIGSRFRGVGLRVLFDPTLPRLHVHHDADGRVMPTCV